MLVGLEMWCVSHKRGGNNISCAGMVRCAFRKPLEGASRSVGSLGIGNNDCFGVDGNDFGEKFIKACGKPESCLR